MAGTVADELDELAGRPALSSLVLLGHPAIDPVADRVDDLQVGPLAAAPDVVHLAQTTLFEHHPQSATVVLHEQPIADIPAVAVYGEPFPFERVQDHQRNQFLGELIGAVVVRAVRDERRQAVGVVVGADEMIRSGLRGGIGRIGSIGSLLGEVAGRPERPVDFVGGDMQEPKPLAGFRFERRPVLSSGIEQADGPDDIGLNERRRPIDRPVHMGFGG